MHSKKYARVYGGCRSSSIDIIDILLNQFDAYIDVRALWPGSGAMLQLYDVVAALPIAHGIGLEISDVDGHALEHYTHDNSIPIIVARPSIKGDITEIVKSAVPETVQHWEQTRSNLKVVVPDKPTTEKSISEQS